MSKEEAEEIVLEMNDKGQLAVKKEPFAIVEVMTDKDWESLQLAIKLKEFVQKGYYQIISNRKDATKLLEEIRSIDTQKKVSGEQNG